MTRRLAYRLTGAVSWTVGTVLGLLFAGIIMAAAAVTAALLDTYDAVRGLVCAARAHRAARSLPDGIDDATLAVLQRRSTR